MSKTLVAYFSASGVTKNIAERLAKTADAGLFEIEPAKPYTAADLNWNDKNSRSTPRPTTPPAAPPSPRSLWSSMNTAPSTLASLSGGMLHRRLSKRSWNPRVFAGKKIVLFATSGGSGMGKTAKVLEASAPGATIVPGAILNGASDAELKQFVERNRS